MKTLLKLLPLLPSLAFAQGVPMMGTAPAQPAPTPNPAAQAPATAPTPASAPKQTQKHAPVPVAIKPQGEILPPPSQVTKDFYQAFVQGNLPLAEMLVQQGADVNCRNCGERTPIVFKIGLGSLESVRWLIARGADVNLPSPTTHGPISPLMASVRGFVWTKEITLTLLQAGANPNWQDLDGNTPFMVLAGRDLISDYKIEGLATMLGRDASINAANKMGQTALMFAIGGSSNCSPQTVQFLLGRGADVAMKTEDGKTAGSIAYQQALKGNTLCNQVMAMLKSPPQLVADAPMPAAMSAGAQPGSVPMETASIQPGPWQGMFNATSPRNASVVTTANVSPGGEVVFSSQAGMRGTGRMMVIGNQLSGSFTAPSPVDANGRPMFKNPDGSTDIVFKISGTVSNGVMRGNYASNFESGNYVMCDSGSYEQTAACKPPQVSAGDLLKAIGGLAGALKGLSNTPR